MDLMIAAVTDPDPDPVAVADLDPNPETSDTPVKGLGIPDAPVLVISAGLVKAPET